MGAVCAILAQSRGRSGGVWFLIGCLAPVLGLILLLVLPDQKIERSRHGRVRDEQKRLRELVRKDRQVADRRQAELEGRLTAHDRALGIDTSERAYLQEEAAPGAVPPPLIPAGVASVDPLPLDGPWFYADSGAPIGPLAFDALRSLWSAGKLASDSLVWRDGMSDWHRLDRLPELREALVG